MKEANSGKLVAMAWASSMATAVRPAPPMIRKAMAMR